MSSPVERKDTITGFSTISPIPLIHNKDLRTEVEYFSDGYDEEREMEPRHAHVRETTSFLRTRSSRARRQRERVVEFEDTPNMEGSTVERNYKVWWMKARNTGVDDNKTSGNMYLPPLWHDPTT
ncbi:hypothetical protein Tco_0702995 [Tanacetum coccineum]|uniref:Uncharacterized protein n=1 Tax=Tanacetum coccineum TaxID=301880 RepID=A0ABQ4XXS5_9ASTR